jgi:sec-independent protein translocase protein TatC
MARSEELSPALQAQWAQMSELSRATADAAPEATGRRPVTLGVGEPFTVTFRVVGYAALLLTLPLLLYQAYAFVLPAFSPREREVALPLMAMVPFLFVGGVVFAYYFVLPNAISFLQNFNDDNYDILLQARDYYKFSIMVLMVMGILFQVPIGILAVTRVGIVTPAQLRKNRRYAILVIAILAMLLPGQDPVTMLMMMAPLIVLFEGSILMAAVIDRRAARAAAREEAELAVTDDGELPNDPDPEED